MELTAPAEAVRRAIGHCGDDVDPLRWIEQQQRMRWRLALRGRGPDDRRTILNGRKRQLRLLGNMAVARGKVQDMIGTQSQAQPVDQFDDSLPVPCFVTLRHLIKSGLRCDQRLGCRNGQPHAVITETGIERIGQRPDPFIEQALHQHRIARGGPGHDVERVDRAVAAIQLQPEAPPALITRGQSVSGVADQGEQGPGDGILMRHRIGKAALEPQASFGLQRADRHLLAAQQAFDRADRVHAEARGNRRHRPGGDSVHRLQPGARQRLCRLRIQPQRRNRQRAQCRRFVDNRPMGKLRQRLRGFRGWPASPAHRHALRHDMIRRQIGHGLFAAEQMRGPGDVDGDRVRRQQHDVRCIADAIAPQPLQPVPVCRCIVFDGDQFGMPRAGIGQRHARNQPQPRGMGIHRDQPERIAGPGKQRDRRVRRRVRLVARLDPPPICRQERKPQRQKSSFPGTCVGHGPTPAASPCPKVPSAGATR